MTCDEWRIFLQDYVDDRLSPPARSAVDTHLSDCADCLREARTHERIVERLRAEPLHDPSPGLIARTLSALPRSGGGWRREIFRLAAAAFLLAALGSTFFFGWSSSLPRISLSQEASVVVNTLDPPKRQWERVVEKVGWNR